MTRYRLGILASHPIQYQAPLFRELAGRLDLTVYFAHRQTPDGQAQAGFGVPFEWDIDLLAGYEHRFLHNIARRPDVNSFFGCDTPQVADELRRNHFDAFLVMGWYLKSYWQAIRACRQLSIHVMVRGDSKLSKNQDWLRRRIKDALYPSMLRQFDTFLYVGQRSREYLLHYGVAEDRLVFSPHCVDNDWFAREADRVPRAEARASLGLADADRAVLFVGKLVEQKRPADVLRALKRVRKDGRAISAIFVGDGPSRHALEQLARELRIPAAFLGFQNQSSLPRLYRAADALVLPSEETWGLVANESLACGTRVVLSNAVGCAVDLIREPEAGAVFPYGDIDALAAAISKTVETAPNPASIRATIDRYSLQSAALGVSEAIEVARRRRGLT